MKILVVGATGFIGGYLTGHLRERGDEVVTSSSKDDTGMDPDTGLFPAQFAIPSGTRAVYYLAQSPHCREGWRRATHILNVNAVSAAHVASMAIRSGVTRFIYLSTGNVYAPGSASHVESSPVRRDGWYELSKVHAEEILALYRDQMDVTVARLFGVYGPRQSGRLVPNLANAVALGKPIVIERNPEDPSDQDGLRISLCYIDDVVKILAALLTSERVPVLNVAGSEVLSVRGIATTIGKAMGRTPLFDLTTRLRAGELIADIGLLKQLLQPKFTPFEIGLRYVLETRMA